jgi:signal transduction histidine kinase
MGIRIRVFDTFTIYRKKRLWKGVLLLFALIIISVSLWYSNILVRKIAQDERLKIRTWANAIQHRAELVNSTKEFFRQIQDEERKRVELYAEAVKRFANAAENEDIKFYTDIINNNTSIPVILTDDKGRINSARNTDFNSDTIQLMDKQLKKEFSIYPPIKINYYHGNMNYIYYKDSKLFTEVQLVLNDLVNSFFNEVVNNSASVPVIITDSTRSKVINSGHVDTNRIRKSDYLQELIGEMASQNDPIVIDVADRGKYFIFYKDSYVLTQLRYFPYIQFAIIGIFLLVAYLIFSTSRRSEQNQVWVGLAKETAHQLGTPLSSMMAWVDYLESKGIDQDTIGELHKDVNRLKTITDRFSKIGSTPVLKPEDIVELIHQSVAYLKTRTSQKISFTENLPGKAVMVPLNYQLFDWVIENLVKNAVDAMTRTGSITIDLLEDEHHVVIDISDSGKGIPRNMFKTIFNPGFSSKQRGWGLGLSLSKRIIREYHRGKIFVKNSTIGKGSTFRIVLKK